MTSQADRLVLRAVSCFCPSTTTLSGHGDQILENSVAKPLPKSARRAVRAGTRISLGNLSATYGQQPDNRVCLSHADHVCSPAGKAMAGTGAVDCVDWSETMSDH